MTAAKDTFIAVTRFGLGAAPGDFDNIRKPRQWLEDQLTPAAAAAAAPQNIPTTMTALRQMQENGMMMRQDRMAAKDSMDDGAKEQLADSIKAINKGETQDFVTQAAAMTRAAAGSPAPFFERLVQFWANHFTVSITKRQDIAFVAPYVQEAIRPHVLGNFHDLLRAATRHPAMEIYLDNQISMGPHSKAGLRQHKGLNENLARETMELHSVGVDGGYTQQDVTEFSKILTGWTIDRQGRGDGSGFFFAPAMHEPGDKFFLGQVYHENGVNEGEQALQVLAHHPSTAKFIAVKLARHFIADDPPPAAVAQLQQAFAAHNGALIPVYRALIGLKEAWAHPLVKLKTPQDLVLSILRAGGFADSLKDQQVVGPLRMLGQMPFTAPSPAGWSDRAADWMSAEALLQRINVARFAGRLLHTRLNPSYLMESTIGPVASAETRNAVLGAGSVQEAITLLFSSPEFQRR
ncbi:MAG: DUF1800 domain-containing protein [Alphaproteobacteria bacterium]|nr:DUF1800 family protein [Alphaproteobacteria bacterium]MDE2337156.1 DUF1800 domain-containing protein [Alphaproteobacteria bacterium]